MIERARWSDLTFAWFTADEEFGQNPGLRDYLEEAEIAYVMAIPKTTEFTDHAGRITFIEKRAARLAQDPNRFLSAVQIDPKITIDPAYKSAELVRMLDDARAAAGDSGEPASDGKTVRLWAKDHRGGLAMEATAIVA